MKITLTLYVLAIIISLALMFRSKMAKKEDYLSTAFDLSIMLTVFLWDKERVSIFLPILLILLFIYFIVLYFGIIRPTRKSESFDVIIQKERKEAIYFHNIHCHTYNYKLNNTYGYPSLIIYYSG